VYQGTVHQATPSTKNNEGGTGQRQPSHKWRKYDT
jgi:hypothetical protein